MRKKEDKEQKERDEREKKIEKERTKNLCLELNQILITFYFL